MATLQVPAGGGNNLKVEGAVENDLAAPADGPGALPEKKGPLLNVLKVNPLSPPAPKDGAASALGGGKHSLGIGKTPVRDLVNKVVGGGKDCGDQNGGGDSQAPE